MIIVLKQNTKPEQLENLEAWIHSMGIETHVSIGKTHTIIGLVGDTSQVDMDLVRALDIVENVKRIQEPFKNANRKFHNEDLVVDIGGVKIGGGNFQIIAESSLLRRVQRAGVLHCGMCEKIRRRLAPRRCILSREVPLTLSKV